VAIHATSTEHALVSPSFKIQENSTSDSLTWVCNADFADDEPKLETFAIRFATSESEFGCFFEAEFLIRCTKISG
jgi:hypothetical protein